MKKIILGLLTLGLVLTVTGCGAAKVMNVPSQPISNKTTNAAVYKAIQKAGVGLGWIVEKSGNNAAKATLNLRTHQAVVLIRYSSKTYAINYKSSLNLKHNASKNTIHKNYNGWVQNLNNAIKVQLSTL